VAFFHKFGQEVQNYGPSREGGSVHNKS